MDEDRDPLELVQDLTEACQQGDRQKVADLLLSDAVLSIINVPNEDGETALYCACDRGHTSVVLELLKVTSIDTQIANTNTGRTPLHGMCVTTSTDNEAACVKKSGEIVAMLLVRGADVSVQDFDKLTPREIVRYF
jgi:ankyrin repeat protein